MFERECTRGCVRICEYVRERVCEVIPDPDPFFEEENLPLLDEGAWRGRRFSTSFASSSSPPPSKSCSSSGRCGVG